MTSSDASTIAIEPDPHPWIIALRATQNVLAAEIEALPREAMHGPSYHSWNISEVLGHLGSQAEVFTAWLEAGLTRSDPPPQELVQRIWDAWNARQPEQKAVDGLAANEAFMERVEGLTQTDLDGFHLSLFGMELDAAHFLQLRLSELALHTWDIAVALDPAARLPAEDVDLLVDALTLTVGWGGKPQEKAFRLHVHTIAPERDFLLTAAERMSLTAWNGDEVDGELRLPAETFIRLVYGRHEADVMPDVEITAPNLTFEDLQAVFPGI